LAAWDVLLDGARSVEQVADLLGVDVEVVRSLADQGRLSCFEHQGVQHFPAWQFDGGAPLPHLAEVIVPLRAAHPLTVEGFMTLSSDELDGQSPAQWLAAGGAIEKVLWLAESLLM
jgi:hypothetical protein